MMASPNSAISDSDRSMYTLFLDVGADHILTYLLSNRNGEQSLQVYTAEGTTSGVHLDVFFLASSPNEDPAMFQSTQVSEASTPCTFPFGRLICMCACYSCTDAALDMLNVHVHMEKWVQSLCCRFLSYRLKNQ